MGNRGVNDSQVSGTPNCALVPCCVLEHSGPHLGVNELLLVNYFQLQKAKEVPHLCKGNKPKNVFESSSLTLSASVCIFL